MQCHKHAAMAVEPERKNMDRPDKHPFSVCGAMAIAMFGGRPGDALLDRALKRGTETVPSRGEYLRRVTPYETLRGLAQETLPVWGGIAADEFLVKEKEVGWKETQEGVPLGTGWQQSVPNILRCVHRFDVGSYTGAAEPAAARVRSAPSEREWVRVRSSGRSRRL
jgi:hypothetical protein